MTPSYKQFEKLFEKRKKGLDYKVLTTDFKLYKLEDGTFKFIYKQFVRWDQISGTKYARITQDALFATLTPDGLATVLYDGPIGMTECNRISLVLGLTVGLNKSHYRNYKQHVRVYRCDSWENSWPYFPGIQANVVNGKRTVVNPQADVQLLVDKSKVQEVKREFDTMRKLVKAMARIGTFDEVLDKHINQRWSIDLSGLPQLDQIDHTDPTADDAMSVVLHGLRNTFPPGSYTWVNNMYTTVSDEDRKRGWLKSGVEKGLSMLRTLYYKENDGYVEHIKLAA